jgi:ATP-dependent Lon protease
MQPGLLPLFPLQVVLFPGAELPLHIFEERYKEMMREVMRDHLEFGVVLASEKGIVNTGCTATVHRVLRQYPDGRLDILTLGRRRFEIVRLNDERPFLRGSVDFFDDEEFDPVPPEIQKRAIEGYNELQALAAGHPLESLETLEFLKRTSPDAAEPMAPSHAPLSFRLAQPVPDLSFRQILLATRSEAGRLRQIADFLPTYLMRQRRIQRLKDVSPRNGHGLTDVK